MYEETLPQSKSNEKQDKDIQGKRKKPQNQTLIFTINKCFKASNIVSVNICNISTFKKKTMQWNVNVVFNQNKKRNILYVCTLHEQNFVYVYMYMYSVCTLQNQKCLWLNLVH